MYGILTENYPGLAGEYSLERITESAWESTSAVEDMEKPNWFGRLGNDTDLDDECEIDE